MIGYNLFQKPIDEVTTCDLTVLRDVPEGWYVEYKREFPGVRSAAKSLSAFANSYGGWLFYGINESSDGHRTAGSYPGVPVSDVPQIEQWLQQAASTQVSPPPYFEVRAIRGPDDALGLADNHAVVLVRVPQGNNAPYLHGSGRVYRRVADASDPTHETDRHFLDLLWRRGRSKRKEFSKFVRQAPEISEYERNTSYIKLYFFPDPWAERGLTSRLDFDSFSALMGDEMPESGGLPFDNIFPMSTGYVARQTRNNDPGAQVFTWKYHSDCASEITLPLNGIEFSSYDDVSAFLDGYEQREEFIHLCLERGLNSGRLIDLSQLFSVLISIVKRQASLLEAEELRWPLFFKAQITGVWRRVPFLDMPEAIRFFEQQGIPVIQEDKCFAPSGTDPDTCLELHERAEVDAEVAPYVDGSILLALIGQTLGLPHHVFGFSQDAESSTLERMIRMGERAITVTRQRSAQLGIDGTGG